MATMKVEKQFTGDDQETGAITVMNGSLNLSITPTDPPWVATVWLQRRFLDGLSAAAGWQDVEPFSGPVQRRVTEDESGVEYRLYVKADGWESGEPIGRLSW